MFYHRTTQINGHCCSVPVTLCLVLLQFLPFRFRIANRLCGNKIQCPSNHKVVVPFLCCSLYIPDPTNLTRPQGIQSKLLLLLLYIPIKATAIPASIYYRYVFVDCRRIVPGRLVCGGDDWKHLKRRGSSAAVSLHAAGREAFCEPHRYANDDRIFVFVRHEFSMGPYSSSFATTSSSHCCGLLGRGFTRGRSPCITRLNKLIDKNHGQLHRALPFWLKTRTRWGRGCRNRLNL